METTAASEGYLARPASGTGPGVVVLHAWWGLNGFIRELCDRLAAEGYLAYAPDMYGGPTTDSVEEAERLAQQSDGSRAQGAALAAIDRLRADPGLRGDGLAVIGFSFGAAYALLISTLRPADIAGVVIYYGTYPIDFSAARAAYQGHFAEADEFEPAENVAQLADALSAGGHTLDHHTYPGTGHWFFETDRPNDYNAAAAALAWERTLAFLQRVIGAP